MQRPLPLLYHLSFLCLCCTKGPPDLANPSPQDASSGPVDSAIPTVSEIAEPLPLGRTATFPSYSITAFEAHDCGVTDAGIPRAGYQLIGVEIEIKNLGHVPFSANPFRAKLLDRDHVEYTTSLTGCPPALSSQLLLPHQSVRGYVSFQLPKALNQAILEYRPALGTKTPPPPQFAVRWGIY